MRPEFSSNSVFVHLQKSEHKFLCTTAQLLQTELQEDEKKKKISYKYLSK